MSIALLVNKPNWSCNMHLHIFCHRITSHHATDGGRVLETNVGVIVVCTSANPIIFCWNIQLKTLVQSMRRYQGPYYQHGLPDINAWISNHIHCFSVNIYIPDSITSCNSVWYKARRINIYNALSPLKLGLCFKIHKVIETRLIGRLFEEH